MRRPTPSTSPASASPTAAASQSSTHWGKDTPEARFLTAARDEACRFFNVVLSPDYNRLHANHFHLDLGGFRMCR